MADQTEVERQFEAWNAAYAAGYEAGARDMRARAANEIEGQREGGKMTNVVQVFDVLGSAVRSLPLTEGK